MRPDMRLKLALASAALFFALASATHAALPQEIDGEPMPSLAPLVKRVAPAVVNIRVSQTVDTPSLYGDEMFRRFFGIPDNPEGRSGKSRAPVRASSSMPRTVTF